MTRLVARVARGLAWRGTRALNLSEEPAAGNECAPRKRRARAGSMKHKAGRARHAANANGSDYCKGREGTRNS